MADLAQHVAWQDADGSPIPWGSVDLDCQCGQTLAVPIERVDSAGTAYLDHDYLAAHHQSHDPA